MIQQTFVMIKPDAVERNLVGSILKDLESAGLTIKNLTMAYALSKRFASFLYEEHKDQSYFTDLIDYTTSGPVVLTILEGENAISVVRQLVGSANPNKRGPETLRSKYAESYTHNSIHSSDGKEAAAKEIDLYFMWHLI